MRITFGVTTRNQLNYTKLCLESFWKQWFNNAPKDCFVDFVVADNDSTDGTVEYIKNLVLLKKEGSLNNYSFTLINMGGNFGTPKSFNTIYKVFDNTKGDYCFFANNDVVFTENYIQNMLDFHKDFPEAGVFSSTCIDSWKVTPEKWFGDLKQKEYEPYIDSDWEKYAKEFREQDKQTVLDGINACVFAVTRECRDKVGNFNEDYVIGCYDDCEYCLLTERAGFRVLNTSNAIVFHWGGNTQAAYREEHGNNSYQQYNKQIFERKFGVNLDAMGARCTRSLFWKPGPDGINERVCI